MKYLFISGIPTSGKSYLAKKIAQENNILHVNLDDLRIPMLKDSNLEPWVNFFWNKDEKTYWETVSPQEHWGNLVSQSEAFWPTVLKKIREIQKSKQSAIFEGVNILPHLAHQDLDFPGIVLIGESEEKVFERCNKNPRWGQTEELQKQEAKWFFVHEGSRYKEEAEKYGYKVFCNFEKAEKELLKFLKK